MSKPPRPGMRGATIVDNLPWMERLE